MFRTIDPLALRNLLDGAEPPLLVDVRSSEEFAHGAIAGARHIELSTLPARIDELDAAAAIVLVCHSGMRSAQACAYLAQRGFAHTLNLSGGIAGWEKAGLPLA
jgi:rhodanese-related sulfurtransferase